MTVVSYIPGVNVNVKLRNTVKANRPEKIWLLELKPLSFF